MGEIMEAMKYDFIAMKQGSKAEVSEIVSCLNGRPSYRRFPIDEDEDLLFFSMSALVTPIADTNPLTEAEVASLDWFSIQNGPVGRNMSGSLGKQAKATDGNDSERVDVLVTSFFIQSHEDTKEIAHRIELEVLAETWWFDPRDLDHLKSYLSVRDTLFRRKLHERNLKWSEQTTHLSEKLSYIDWPGYTYDKFRELIEAKLLTEDQKYTLLAEVGAERKANILAGKHRKHGKH